MDKFPKRVYTTNEVQEAKKLVELGYKHRLTVKGSSEFKQKVREALKLIKTAGYYQFLRTYIRQIIEINGFSQLRESEVAIWANKYSVADSVDAASLFIQKAHQMKNYLEGKPYYGGTAEMHTIQKRIEFLKNLKNKTRKPNIKVRCEQLLKSWAESIFL